jgi:hypothetical protein
LHGLLKPSHDPAAQLLGFLENEEDAATGEDDNEGDSKGATEHQAPQASDFDGSQKGTPTS